MNFKSLNRFCFVALLEGISYIALLGIAMPLKYFMDMPEAVKYTGWAHGLLFVAYIILLINCAIQYNWKLGRILLVFVASLLPFAPFIVEKKLKKEAAESLALQKQA